MVVALGLGAFWLKEHRKEVGEQAAAAHRIESQAASVSAAAAVPQVKAAQPEAPAPACAGKHCSGGSVADAAKPVALPEVKSSGEAAKTTAGAAARRQPSR